SGFLLDNLSLMALTVATGFVVDDAIVVVENIARHVEEGMQPMKAALKGSREVGFTVLSISLSLIAVFTPLIFMGGLVGRLFREFALTMSAAVAISLVASLTVTPMLASRVLAPETEKSGFFKVCERFFNWLQRGYVRQLDWALAHRGPVLLLLAGTIVLNGFLIAVAPKGFFPTQDVGGIQGGVRADQAMSFQQLSDKFKQLVNIIQKDPAVAGEVAFSGGSRSGGGFVFVNLKPRAEREDVNAVIERLRPKLARVRGVSLFLNPVQDIQAGGRQTSSSYQYVMQADNPQTLADAGDKMLRALKAKPNEVADVDIDQQDAGASAYVTVDRVAAARLGIPMYIIDDTLYDAFGQRQV
ncbi:MAG TPA: efflux RND transporter permease subunit, partial [Novosphingobium sp.]|nr:efflux RND transporter permease subunit [Novosphingobium sp.]